EEPALQQAEKERAWPGASVSDPSEWTEPGANGAADWAVDGPPAGSFERASTAAVPHPLHGGRHRFTEPGGCGTRRLIRASGVANSLARVHRVWQARI